MAVSCQQSPVNQIFLIFQEILCLHAILPRRKVL
uniref:Uncharacterized protein n=1 Tax=Anguilla anguilla TaxID=7936 RepID=A0A0E9TQD6_ANGAN